MSVIGSVINEGIFCDILAMLMRDITKDRAWHKIVKCPWWFRKHIRLH